MKKLLILGAGGQGKVVLDLALQCERWDEIAFLDNGKIGERVLGYEVIGGIEQCKMLLQTFTHAIVAIGNNALRLKLTKQLLELGYLVPTLIHPSAVVSSFAEIEEGTVVLPKAVIHTSAKIGKGVIVNTGAIVEHDCRISDGVHLSPRATLGGTVKVGDLSWICLGANVIHGIEIGNNVVVGAGAVVIDKIEDDKLVVGVPAKTKEL